MMHQIVRRAFLPLESIHQDISGLVALLGESREESDLLLAEQLARNVLRAVGRARAVVEHLAQRVDEELGAGFGRGILVVDDDTALLGTLRRTLRGYKIVTTASPCEALARIAAGERFAFILSDLSMPEMSGDILLREVAQVDAEQAERFVFMTAGVLTPQASEALALAGRPVLRKPFGAKSVWRLFAGVRSA